MNWKKTIKLKHLLDDDDSDKHARSTGLVVSGVIAAAGLPPELSDPFRKVRTLNQFNQALNDLYDYCDCNAIWVD